MNRLAVVLLMGLVLLLAACSGTPADNSPVATADGGAAATQDEPDGDDGGAPTATQEPGEDGDDDGVANPGGATDLEALLPDEVAGIELTKASFNGANIDEEAGFNLEGIASAAGAQLEDVSLATAVDEANGVVTIFAVRIEGLSGEQTMNAALENDDTGLSESVEEANIGGKDVLTSGGVVHLYASDDVLFQVYAAEGVAEEVFSQLP